jgi:hypothetical protein
MAAMFKGDELLNVYFFNHPVPDVLETKAKGRPIDMDVEHVQIKAPGDRNTIRVFPATDVYKWVDDPHRGRIAVTYAERFSEQYKQFKASQTQTVKGTSLDELPFLSQSKRGELRALGIYTAEMLAAIDGQPLKNLGMGGRELSEKAKAYIANSEKGAGVNVMAEEMARLKAELEKLKAQAPENTDETPSPFLAWEDDDIKSFIKDATGAAPRGNPNHASLVRMADEANAALKKQNEAA